MLIWPLLRKLFMNTFNSITFHLRTDLTYDRAGLQKSEFHLTKTLIKNIDEALKNSSYM
jgi:hypothetical protein